MRRGASFTAVIPARYASTRLPGKPLLDIAGKPMVVRVAERAQASGASAVIVATDDQRIQAACQAHGVDVLMTRADHPSGTDRLAEVVARLQLEPESIMVNVQGDEPLIAPRLISRMAQLLAGRDAPVATACCPILSAAELFNPNAVKVVLDRNGYALYFSRAPIPWARDAFGNGSGRKPFMLPDWQAFQRHIGIYAYRAGFLAKYKKLRSAPLERLEALEQLRMLWHGERIAVARLAGSPEAGVDTPADLRRVRAAFARLRLKRAKRTETAIDRPRKAR